MVQISEEKLGQCLSAAGQSLIYSQYITEFVLAKQKEGGKENDEELSFYIKTCNVFFGDSLLLVGSLLDNNKKHPNTISFFRNPKILMEKESELKAIKDQYYIPKLKDARDQVIGHQDDNNISNMIPIIRTRRMIDPILISELDKIIGRLISILESCYPEFGLSYFNLGKAKEEIQKILKLAPSHQ